MIKSQNKSNKVRTLTISQEFLFSNVALRKPFAAVFTFDFNLF